MLTVKAGELFVNKGNWVRAVFPGNWRYGFSAFNQAALFQHKWASSDRKCQQELPGPLAG